MVCLSKLSKALVVTVTVSGALAAPRLDKRQIAAPLAITGASTTGEIYPRQEIRDIEANPELLNLFVQAMESFQAAPQDQVDSFHGCAQIHGMPYTDWDGVAKTGDGNGYCTHSSNLFPTWHRPYLVLFEQSLQKHAVQVANQLGGDYPSLANELRLPFWDWADPSKLPIIPTSMSSSHVQVTRPGGQTETIKNPLFAYRFHPLDPEEFAGAAPFDAWHMTKRWADSDQVGAVSDNDAANTYLEQGMEAIRERLYGLLTNEKEFNLFSNKGSGENDGDNLESIHDSIHGSFGANSSMSFPIVAAYDPIFWMHHAQIDRLIAIFQTLYPETFVADAPNQVPTWTIKTNEVMGADSELKPFHRDTSGNFWTSRSVRHINRFSYSYPELYDNPDEGTLIGRINDLYAPSQDGVTPSMMTFQEFQQNVQQGVQSITEHLSNWFNDWKRSNTKTTAKVVNLDDHAGFLDARNKVDKYVAKISMPVNPLDRTYSIAIFLGDFDRNPRTWGADEPNYVGEFTSIPVAGGKRTDITVHGTVPLTQALLRKFEAGDIKKLDRDSVQDYLRKNLHWRVFHAGEEKPVARREIEGLKVKVVRQDVEPKSHPKAFPKMGDREDVPDVRDDDDQDPPN